VQLALDQAFFVSSNPLRPSPLPQGIIQVFAPIRHRRVSLKLHGLTELRTEPEGLQTQFVPHSSGSGTPRSTSCSRSLSIVKGDPRSTSDLSVILTGHDERRACCWKKTQWRRPRRSRAALAVLHQPPGWFAARPVVAATRGLGGLSGMNTAWVPGANGRTGRQLVDIAPNQLAKPNTRLSTKARIAVL
jgi:hypothetical protein